MSDALEQELRSVLAEQALTLPPGARERLTSVDYLPSSGVLPRVSAGFGACVAALAAAAVVALLMLFSAGTTGARFVEAGWNPFPKTPSAAEVAHARAICKTMHGAPGMTASLSGRLMLSEQRGRVVAALYDLGTEAGLCISGPDRGGAFFGVSAVAPLRKGRGSVRVGPPQMAGGTIPGFPGVKHGSLTVPARYARLESRPRLTVRQCVALGRELNRVEGVDFEAEAVGRAGGRVTGVTLTFSDHRPVQATVRHGWYFAWWPRMVWPTHMVVTSASGTHSQLVPGEQARAASIPSRYCRYAAVTVR